MEIKSKNVLLYLKKPQLTFLMRTVIFLFTTAIFSLTPSNIISQNSGIKIAENQNLTVDQVFELIMQQTDYNFVYEDGIFANFPTVEVKKGKISTTKLLQKSLFNRNLNIIVSSGNTIIIREESVLSKFQQKEVSGTVTDKSGLPLPGVTVIIKGTTTGTTTNFEGKYTIQVPNPEHVLEFTFLGFQTQEILVGNQTTINAILEEDIQELGEIVLTGYQKISKERITGSVSKLDSEDLERVVAPNVASALEGAAPGLLIDNNPDGTASISIRGQNSFTGRNAPLIVVDGFPVNVGDDSNINIDSENILDIRNVDDGIRGNILGSLNPNDIESIVVLKDAAASSIYGVKSANGVIVIETKNGKKGEVGKTNVTYTNDFIFGLGKPDLGDLLLMNSEQMLDIQQEMYDKGVILANRNGDNDPFLFIMRERDLTGNITPEEAERQIELLASRSLEDQFSKLFLSPSSYLRHNITISGRTNKVNYFVSPTFSDTQNGVSLKNNDSRRFQLQSTFGIKDIFLKNLNLDVNILNSFSTTKRNFMSINGAANLPYNVPLDEQGNQIPQYNSTNSAFPHQYEILKEQGFLDWTYNMKQDFDALDNVTRNTLNRIQGTVTYDIISNIKISSQYQYDISKSNQENFRSLEQFDVRNQINRLSTYSVANGFRNNFPRKPNLRVANSELISWLFRNQVDFNFDFLDKGKVNALAGAEVQKQTGEWVKNDIWGYDPVTLSAELIDYANLANVGVPGRLGPNTRFSAFPFTQAATDSRFISSFANIGITWNNKYDITASGRIDRTNFFGTDPDVRKARFWSLGTGWTISSEKFMDNTKWVDHLKLRVTHGFNGNVTSTEGQVLIAFANPFFNRTSTGEQPLSVSTLPNPRLRWERVAVTNFGLDFNLFNNRFSGSIEYFNKNATDIFAREEVDPTFTPLEVTTMGKNFGKLQNQGIDIQLNVRPIVTNNFSWNSTLNFGSTTSEVKEADTPNTIQPHRSNEIFRAGDPVDAIYAYRYDGLDEEGLPRIFRTDGEIAAVTDLEVDLEKVKVGVFNPKYFGGFINTFNYKGFNLSATFTYQLGHQMRGPFGPANRVTLYSRGLSKYLEDRWREPGDELTTDIPGVGNASTRFRDLLYRYANSDRNIEPADIVRLRYVSLGYNFPKNIFQNSFIKGINLNLQFTNLWYWAANKYNIDSESWGRVARYNLSSPGYQQPSTSTLTVRVNF